MQIQTQSAQLSAAQRATVSAMLNALPARLVNATAHCPDAGYTKSSNPVVNVYRHFLLLRDDLRYHVNYNGKKPKDLTRYVYRNYPELVKGIKAHYFGRNRPKWEHIEAIEKAGIPVVWKHEERVLEFHIEGGVLSI